MPTNLKPNERYSQPADHATLLRVAEALQKNGMHAVVVSSGAEAKQKVREIIPEGAEVMDMTSMTLQALNLAQDIGESGRYVSLRKRLTALDEKSQGREKRQLGAAPDWVIGSVHAVTEDGQVLVASATGSQLPAYAYGAPHVLWVVGAQKVVKNLAEGLRRLHEYSFPLEDERALKAYGVHSGVHKVLLVNKEVAPGRITMILVEETLGF